MKKNYIDWLKPSLFTWSLYEIIYAALLDDYLAREESAIKPSCDDSSITTYV